MINETPPPSQHPPHRKPHPALVATRKGKRRPLAPLTKERIRSGMKDILLRHTRGIYCNGGGLDHFSGALDSTLERYLSARYNRIRFNDEHGYEDQFDEVGELSNLQPAKRREICRDIDELLQNLRLDDNIHPDIDDAVFEEINHLNQQSMERSKKIVAGIKRFLRDRENPPRAEEASRENVDAKKGDEVVSPKSGPSQTAHEMLDHLTHPVGVLGAIVNWIVESAQRPNRVLALGAAITVLATIIGRRVAGPTWSGTHLYVIMLAMSAAGKDHPLRRAIGLLNAVNPALVGPGEFTSQNALLKFVSEQQLSLCAIDEFGAFVARICHPRAGSWERGLLKTLREFWGASFDIIPGMQWASTKTEAIRWPALSLLGVSTHQEFFDAMSSKEATNGFLNRFLMLSTVAKIVDVDEPTASKFEVPQDIDLSLTELYANCLGGEDLSQIRPEEHVECRFNTNDQITIGWADDEVRDDYRQLKNHALAKADTATIGEIYGRTAEMAVRLATIHAVSRAGLEAKVTHEDFAWGRELAMWSADTMAREASMRMSDTEAQARANHVQRIIYEAGGKIKHRDLNRKLQHRFKPQELKDAIQALMDSGTIEKCMTQPKGGGTQTITYVLRKQNGSEGAG